MSDVHSCKVFLASSSQLESDRREFEVFIGRKNKDWVGRGRFVELVIWEDFLDAMSRTRLQDEYDRAVQACDLFVVLFWTRVGPYTEEEFNTALAQFRRIGRPLIFTYFKEVHDQPEDAGISDLAAIARFQDRLLEEGHYFTSYRSADHLALHFGQQLDKLASAGFVRLVDTAPASETLIAVRQLADAIGAATHAMLTMAERVGADATAQRETIPDDAAIAARNRLIQLAHAAKQLLWVHQARLVEDLDEWLGMKRRSSNDWKLIIERISKTMDWVRDFLERLKGEHSEFVLDSAYDTLLGSTGTRLAILERLAGLGMPDNDAETEAVRQLSARYKTLLRTFEKGIEGLGNYLQPRAAERERREREHEAQEAIERNARIDEIIRQALAKKGSQ